MRFLRRHEIALGFLIATMFWTMAQIFLNQNPQQRPRVNPPQTTAERVESYPKSDVSPTGYEEPASQQKHGGGHGDAPEFYGVKPGEFLLFFATVGLWYATARLVVEARTGTRQQLEALQRSADAQSRDMRESIKAADRSARAAEEALINTDRAWIKLDVRLTGPLTFNEQGAMTSLIVSMNNVGRSPALRAHSNAWLFVQRQGGESMLSAQERLCEQIRSGAVGPHGPTLFPNEALIEGTQTPNVTKAEIDEGMLIANNGSIFLFIFGCASYVLPGDTEKRRHQTRFLYELTDKTLGKIEPSRASIAVGDLALRPIAGIGFHVD